MGKVIRMGLQERRLLRPKRLRWSRFLFLLGMLIIGSTYQHLRRPQGLLSVWAEVSSQQPIKLANQDLPSDETMMVSSKPPKVSSEVEGEMAAPQAAVGRDQAPPSMTRESTPSPRRTAKTIPTTSKNNHSPTAAGTKRAKENTSTTRVLNRDTPTSGRPPVKLYIPTPREEMKSYSATRGRRKGESHTTFPAGGTVDTYTLSTFMTMETGHRVTPNTTVQGSETMATYELSEANSPKRIVEETTPATLKGIVNNTPTFPTHKAKINILTSPRNLLEKDALSSPRRGESNSSARPRMSVGKNKLKTPQEAALGYPSATSEGQVTISTVTGSSPVKTNASTAAWSVRNPWPQSSATTTRTASATHWEVATKPSTARRTSVTPKVRAIPTTHVRHCVAVAPAPATPSTPSHSPTVALLPGVPSPSLSAPLPGWPEPHPKAEYPPDLFSVEERQQGWVVLHIFGMMYVFVALAIICDEYFVPALGVITDKLQISEDVAGATFMAAGGSAPELFTSLIGVFISHSNVGISTIVGSAVFNILFVIGTCALFSREILNLTWWPLFRDVSFYILDLSMLIVFFLDSLIAWWESLLLLLAYALYVFTMKWNKQIEVWVKEQLSRRPVAKIMALGDLSKPGDGAIAADEHQDHKKLKLPSVLTRGGSSASLHNSTIGTTIYQLMLHSLDPLGEARPSKDKEERLIQEARPQPQAKAESKAEDEEPAELPAITVTPALAPDVQGDQEEDPGGQEDVAGAERRGERTDEEGEISEKSGGDAHSEGEGEMGAGKNEHEDKTETEGKKHEGETEAGGKDEQEDEGEIQAEDGEMQSEAEAQEVKAEVQEVKNEEKDADGEGRSDGGDSEEDDEEDEEEDDEEEEEEGNEEPLSLTWPETRQKRAIYLFLLPIVFPLWLTVPNVRRQESRKFFVITFLGSIIWIAMFSYLMVWWAHQVGETIGISEEIMGLTILAAGTSIPDLITSVIVARKGLGDMAVSSSVGSNIFDITVGLPVPWLLFSLINALQPVPVSSNGLFCAIVLLFLMLLFVISSIAWCKWRMNKILGFTMLLLYFVFLIISVMLEDRIISCPVSA
ncbi:sodium/potassium/calcium exchanger 1 isoform X1 [Heterocephalus glaber]|uniref:Sodium/potassium/calcium exchanger 1 n=1 Tax=Heterocephalus glaber TaxID=10181 RepID=A0AAX6PNY6_HETGA|nr:sodium/potassium/calcium exchanger 1 isoform X1 [Heterocephalus glaber]